MFGNHCFRPRGLGAPGKHGLQTWCLFARLVWRERLPGEGGWGCSSPSAHGGGRHCTVGCPQDHSGRRGQAHCPEGGRPWGPGHVTSPLLESQIPRERWAQGSEHGTFLVHLLGCARVWGASGHGQGLPWFSRNCTSPSDKEEELQQEPGKFSSHPEPRSVPRSRSQSM